MMGKGEERSERRAKGRGEVSDGQGEGRSE